MKNVDIQDGLDLLLACLVTPATLAVVSDTDAARAQRLAVAELDQDDEPIFARISASLRRHYPAVGEYVFHKLAPSRGSLAVKGWATFLGRLDMLDQGTDEARDTTREGDREAVEFLATRNLGPGERARYAELVQTALGPSPPLPDAPPADEEDDERRKRRTALKLWYDEWATASVSGLGALVLVREGFAGENETFDIAREALLAAGHLPTHSSPVIPSGGCACRDE